MFSNVADLQSATALKIELLYMYFSDQSCFSGIFTFHEHLSLIASDLPSKLF